MDALIEALGLGPIAALVLLVVGAALFVCWKLAKIDSRMCYVMRGMKENHAEHEKLWTEMGSLKDDMGGVRSDIGHIKGYIERDQKG